MYFKSVLSENITRGYVLLLLNYVIIYELCFDKRAHKETKHITNKVG